MKLSDLIDVSEVPLVVSEGGYDKPFFTIHVNNYYSSEFQEVLTTYTLSRKVNNINICGGLLLVDLEEDGKI